MGLDYKMIGVRIRRCRKKQNLTQMKIAEAADISEHYLSNIERAVSIPSTEVIMRLAAALDTTPDEFLVGTTRRQGTCWKNVSDQLRPLNDRQLNLVAQFIAWVTANIP